VTAPLRAVVFDLFDTLVDLQMENMRPIEHKGVRVVGTAPALHETLAEALPDLDFARFVEAMRAVDGEFRESRYAKGLELPTGERFAALLERLGAPSDKLAEELTRVHMDALRSQVRAVDHHPELLAALRARVPLALCSNFSHSETARRVLREADLHLHLDVVVISDEAGIRKPRPEIFRAVLDALGTAPEETLHVGDNLSADIAGARGVGMRTAWVTRRVRDPDKRLLEHDGPAPDHRVSDLSELTALLP
jgi:putative hydrolase of the HAD superfamily